MRNYEDIKDYLLNHIDEIGSIVSEINSIDNSLEYLEYFDNDEEFFNTYFYNNPMEVARSVFYGDYRYCDKYVAFDGCGNLTSLTENELENKYKDYIDDIVEALIEHYQEISICDNELNNLVEKYFEETKR